MSKPLRVIIRGLEEMGTVELRGQEYGGIYFSVLLATNPELPEDEANRTPRLISELGRLTAAALYEKEQAEAYKAQWQAGVVWELTNDLEVAENAGFICASADEDEREKDAKGKAKPQRVPSKTAAEDYSRTLPEYLTHKTAIHAAEEAWGVCHTALDGARARQWSIKAWEKTGGTATVARHTSTSPTNDDPTLDRHPGHGDRAEVQAESREHKEASVVAGDRTPLPALPPVPPPPPGSDPTPKQRKKTPPPPP